MSTLHETAVECDGGKRNFPFMSQSLAAISNRLTHIREAVGLSAADLCRALKIQQNRWSQYESGERRITLDVAARLVKRYGVTLDYIYLGDESGLPKRIVDRLENEAAE